MPEDDISSDENSINIIRSETSLLRIQKAFPKQDEITHLGEEDVAFEPVLIELMSFKNMTEFLKSNMSVELGGAIYGNYCIDPTTGQSFTEVKGFVTDPRSISTVGTFNFTPENWAHFNRVVDQRDTGERILGWVHSHPDNYPPVPSGQDRTIMRDFFNQPQQITLILGRGGELDNSYALWRWQDDEPRLQKGIDVVNGSRAEVQKTFSYYKTTGAPSETKEHLVITEEEVSSEPEIKISEEDLK